MTGGLLVLTQVWLISERLGKELLVGLVSAAILVSCLRFPEIAFALFLNAGMFKADPRLDSLSYYIDVTLLFLILTLVGALQCIRRKRLVLALPPKRVLLPFLLIVLLALVSLLYTWAPTYGTQKFERLAVLTFAAFIGPTALFQDEERLKRFFATYIALTTLMVLTLIFGGQLQVDAYGQESVFSSGYLGLGSVTAQATLILLFFYAPRVTGIGQRTVCFTLLLLNAFGIFVSGARGSALGFATAVVCVFLYAGIILFRKGPIAASLRPINSRIARLFIIFSGLAALGFWQLYSYFITLFARTEDLFYSAGVVESERIDMYFKSIRILLDWPKGLIGIGFGGWSMYYYGFDASRGGFPHNVLLEVGVELGWIGLASLSCLIIAATITAIGITKTQSPEQYLAGLTLLALFIYMFMYSSFHGDITDCRQLFTWVAAIYAYKRIALAGKVKRHQPQTPPN